MAKNLKGVNRLYLDANILIYLLEGNQDTQTQAQRIFKTVAENEIELITSEITLTECLVGAIRNENSDLIERYNNLFSEEGFLTLIPVTRRILVETAKTSAIMRLKTVDALHFSTALIADCEALVTNDKGFKSTDEIQIIPFASFE